MKQENATRLYLEKIYPLKDDIYRIIFNVVTEHYLAEELTQIVFARAWKFIDTLEDVEKSRNWLKAITRNVLRDHMRRKAARWREEAGEVSMELICEEDLKAMEHDILEVLIVKEDVARLFKALETLDSKYQNVIREHLIGDLTLKEISEYHNLKYGNVRVRYSRGIKLLREAYEKLEKGGEADE